MLKTQHTKKTYYGPKLGVQSMAQHQGRKKWRSGGVASPSGLQPRLEERWAGSALDAAHAVGVPVVVLLLDPEGIEGRQGGTAFGKRRGEGHGNGAGGRIRGRRASLGGGGERGLSKNASRRGGGIGP